MDLQPEQLTETDAKPTLEIDRVELCRQLGLDPEQITSLTIDVEPGRQVLVRFAGVRKLTDRELHDLIAAATR